MKIISETPRDDGFNQMLTEELAQQRAEQLLEITQNVLAVFALNTGDYKTISAGLENTLSTLLHRPSYFSAAGSALDPDELYLCSSTIQSCIPASVEGLLQLVDGSAYAFIKDPSPRAAMMHLLSALRVPTNMNLHIILDPPDLQDAYEQQSRNYSCAIRLVPLDPAEAIFQSQAAEEEVYMGPDFGREAELDALTPPPFIYYPMRVTLQRVPWRHADERDYYIYQFIWCVDD